MNSNYQTIADIISDVLPKDWERLCLYGDVTADTYEFYFYVKIYGEYIQCFNDCYMFSREEVSDCFSRLHEVLKNDEPILGCASFTFVLSKDGKLKIDFDYDTHDDIVEQRKTWREKYLI